jgi:hypothetical protein
MDVLNFISWIKRKDYRETMPPDALTVVGVPDPTRDDKYLSIVVPISAFGSYTLPIASSTTLGGIKIGSGLTINSSGVLSTTGLSGLGLQDYVARWTPNNTTLGYGVIRDNGTTLGIGTAPTSSRLLTISSSIYDIVAESTNLKNGSFGAIAGSSRGVGPLTNYGAQFTAVNSTTENIGTFTSAIYSTAGINVGLQAVANNSSTDQNYAVQLQDHTVGIGKVLTCMSTDGHANWIPTISRGYVTIIQNDNTLTAVLSGILGDVTYDWSFADSDPGFVFTSLTMLQNVTISRITDTSQYLPFLIEIVSPDVYKARKYSALVKLRVIDENGFVYSDTYNYSESIFTLVE